MQKYHKILLLSILLLAFIVGLPVAQQNGGGSASNCGLLPSGTTSQLSSSEPWYCPINQQIYNEWAPYVGIASAVMALSFFIAGIIFMIGVAFKSERVRSFGVGEFYEACATLFILAAFLYISAIIFGVWPGVYVGAINPYATSFNLMLGTINSAEQMYTALFKVYISLSESVSQTIAINLGNEIPGSNAVKNFIGFLPQLFVNVYTLAVTAFFLNPATAIAGFLTDGITALYAEYYLLVFFSVAAVPVFLIPGVLFRAIFPTRALGGLLIALAFGFYLIMPSLFAVAYYFTATGVQRDMSLSTLGVATLGYQSQQITGPQSLLVQQLDGVQSSLNGFWLMIFFYPGLIIAITYAAVREMASFIGRSVNIAGRMRSFI